MRSNYLVPSDRCPQPPRRSSDRTPRVPDRTKSSEELTLVNLVTGGKQLKSSLASSRDRWSAVHTSQAMNDPNHDSCISEISELSLSDFSSSFSSHSTFDDSFTLQDLKSLARTTTVPAKGKIQPASKSITKNIPTRSSLQPSSKMPDSQRSLSPYYKTKPGLSAQNKEALLFRQATRTLSGKLVGRNDQVLLGESDVGSQTGDSSDSDIFSLHSFKALKA
jgi:hypothetical protein